MENSNIEYSVEDGGIYKKEKIDKEQAISDLQTQIAQSKEYRKGWSQQIEDAIGQEKILTDQLTALQAIDVPKTDDSTAAKPEDSNPTPAN